MSISLLTFGNDIMQSIFENIDKESYLIVGLSCKNLYEILKTLNSNKKLIGSLNYLISNINLLKYAHKNGCPWGKDTCKFAAKNGHLDWNNITIKKIINATSNGQLECLKYAHENGCQWDKNTCSHAAEKGHLECLKYCLIVFHW